MNSSTTTPLTHFLSPRYWLSWISLALLWCVCRLPYRAAMAIGRALGWLVWLLPSAAKKVAYRNVERCFPQMSPTRQKQMVKNHFLSMGMGLIEVFLCWWRRDVLLQRTHFEGLEQIAQLRKQNQAIILLTGHFTTLEVGGTLINTHFPIAAMQREQSNELFSEIMLRSRMRNLDRVVNRNAIRELTKYLKQGGIAWYAPDQNYNGPHSVFAEFFEVPAATTSATSRLARMTGAVVVPFYQVRDSNSHTYRVIIGKPLAGIPSNDIVEDTRVANRAIEAMVRQAPDQYLWSHRRFKNLPERYGNLYE